MRGACSRKLAYCSASREFSESLRCPPQTSRGVVTMVLQGAGRRLASGPSRPSLAETRGSIQLAISGAAARLQERGACSPAGTYRADARSTIQLALCGAAEKLEKQTARLTVAEKRSIVGVVLQGAAARIVAEPKRPAKVEVR